MFYAIRIMGFMMLLTYCKSLSLSPRNIKSIFHRRQISIIKMVQSEENDGRRGFFTKRVLSNKIPNTTSPTNENSVIKTKGKSSLGDNSMEWPIVHEISSTELQPAITLRSTSPKAAVAQKRMQQVKALQAQLPSMEEFRAMKKISGVLPPNARRKTSKQPETAPSTSTFIIETSTEGSTKSKSDGKTGPYSVFSQFRKNPVKLLRALQAQSGEGKFAPEMALVAIRAFQKLNTDQIEGDVVNMIIHMWLKSIEGESASSRVLDSKMVTTLVRELCRMQRMEAAYRVTQACGMDPLAASQQAMSNENQNRHGAKEQLPSMYEEKLLPELAFGFTTSNNFSQAVLCLEAMSNYNLELNLAVSKKILQNFLMYSDLYYIRRCVRVLIKLNGISDQDSVQILANYFMQHCDFVKGAVSMDTLPPGLYPEVAFIGRSNVGKSSLLNMVSNRKGLAYVSKTPGKTSEFNYFYANGTLGHKFENHHFYLVDLPGVGYAEVRKDKRDSWLRLLKSYVEERPTLRLLFHLIDSRHGFLASDDDCLDLLKTLPDHVQYVVVLTKCDKRGGGMKVDMIEAMQATLQRKMSARPTILESQDDNSPDPALLTSTVDASQSSSTEQSKKFRRIPIIQTSSEYKEGGAELWSFIIDAVAGENIGELFYGPKND